MSSPTLDEIRTVARKAIHAFAASSLQCCLFGSTACKQYGASRHPHDIDLIVLASDISAEVLKEMLTQRDTDFYLIRAKNPAATYKVLYHRLASRGRTKRSCKVDILTPGIINIPNIPPSRIETVGALPLVPLLPLLLLKLQGWIDRAKQPVDVADIAQLLVIVSRRGDKIGQENLGWLPDEFVMLARSRVRKYVAERKETTQYWEALGFETGLAE
ncbi:hypothetical protein B0H21DRAFT_845764 [Amylocystis lapponica]|nr:hypothetical protein B0H21DRAFT_845764 [Amylocystis lapponica]